MAQEPSTPSIWRLLESRLPRTGATKLVGIDGHGGSGKSTLAELLADHLGAEIIHTDDFASWDNPKDWWPSLIRRVLEPLADGAETLSYPRSQLWPGHDPEPIVEQPVTHIMLLEGVSALRSELRRFLTAGVFITAPRETCLERGLQRDARGGSTDELKNLWEQYYNDEEGYLRRDNPEAYADLVLDGTRPFECQFDIGC